jgi:hypothetical protein
MVGLYYSFLSASPFAPVISCNDNSVSGPWSVERRDEHLFSDAFNSSKAHRQLYEQKLYRRMFLVILQIQSAASKHDGRNCN